MEEKELEQFRQVLLQMRRKLSDNIGHLHDEALKTAGEQVDELSDVQTEHLADQGLVSFVRDLKLSILQNNDTELCDVNAALAKIEEGTYGECENCDGRISRRRLKALPFARLCIECRQEEERLSQQT